MKILGNSRDATPDATTERQSLQRGEPAQRAASETSATRWLINRVSRGVSCPPLPSP
jgi:hypothetical protein